MRHRESFEPSTINPPSPPPRLSCLICAEAYAWGDSGSNTCPENATRIGSAEACRRAAAAMGKDWRGSENGTGYPSDCYGWKGSTYASFNAHPVGSGYPETRPLCAVGAARLALARDATCGSPWYNVLAGCTGTAENRHPRQHGVQPEPLHHAAPKTDPSILVHAVARGCRIHAPLCGIPGHCRSTERRRRCASIAQVAAAARFRRHPRRYPTQRVRHRTLRRVPWVHPCTTQAGKHARSAAEWTSPIAQLPCSSDMRLLPHANFGIPNFAETPASARFHSPTQLE